MEIEGVELTEGWFTLFSLYYFIQHFS
jgi:hypothetical protein